MKRNKVKVKLTLERVGFFSRWRQPKYARSSDWVFIGVGRWYASFEYVKYYVTFIGFELSFLFNRKIEDK